MESSLALQGNTTLPSACRRPSCRVSSTLDCFHLPSSTFPVITSSFHRDCFFFVLMLCNHRERGLTSSVPAPNCSLSLQHGHNFLAWFTPNGGWDPGHALHLTSLYGGPLELLFVVDNIEDPTYHAVSGLLLEFKDDVDARIIIVGPSITPPLSPSFFTPFDFLFFSSSISEFILFMASNINPIEYLYEYVNIKSCVPIRIDLDKLNYDAQCELFTTHCIGYGVHDHLLFFSSSIYVLALFMASNTNPIEKPYEFVNIKSSFLIRLDLDKLNYDAWHELFATQCIGYGV
ncbi:unnamed protein product [Lactuca saligna]|uniref:Uncharacterized protein n=1 Tax=Lactuca saligna TaxID=75948 RepID=A0AA36E9X4_LACSI|nr:unnamed protein product [Lactuca saligna]